MSVEQIWKKIINRKGLTLLAIPGFCLWLISLFYRSFLGVRRLLASRPEKLSLPVISVGNITVGGTGKTPLVGFLAGALEDEGLKVGIVSSAYGRRDQKPFLEPGYRLQRMNVAVTGDEVQLLAQQVPNVIFSVANSKLDAARALAESGDVDVIILDDGFQHTKLARDINIVAFDAAVKRRVMRPFPAGTLRENIKGLSRADIIIITRAKFAKDITKLSETVQGYSTTAELYNARFSATTLSNQRRSFPVKYLEDKSLFLFAGIGNFQALRKQVDALCSDLDGWLEFDDHQQYTQETVDRINRLANRHDSDLLLTTAKDWAKLAHFKFDRELFYLDLVIDLDPGEETLIRNIMKRLMFHPEKR